MVNLVIKNTLEGDEKFFRQFNIGYANDEAPLFKQYDTEKWKHERRYEFENLRELQEFVDTINIEFTDEVEESFSGYDWWEIDTDLYICREEDNTMALWISIHEETRD